MASAPKKRGSIAGAFAWRLIEMLESPAHRVLSLSGRRILDRLEIELYRHGCKPEQNGLLPCTYDHFCEFSIHRHAIGPAISEFVALGFVEITRKGSAGNAGYRQPTLYRLTYRHAGSDKRVTDDWRRIKTIEDADALLARLGASGATKVVVESAHRFARDLWVQETGHRLLQKLGVELIAADSPGAFVDDGPTAVMVRQILGTVAQLEKAALVLKLRAARERTGHLGGWPKVSDSHPETARRARELTGSLRSIARVLALEGFASSTGRPFTPKTVAAMRSSAS